MIRKKIFNFPKRPHQRGKEVFRIEALSDAVFGFSVSLLIMSLEVPETFQGLKVVIRQILPFLTTFALVFLFWYQQHSYFRNYGLNDLSVIVLNLVLLAWLLVYIFPLKFLFSLLLGWVTHINFFPHAAGNVLTEHDFPILVLFFSAGYTMIWSIFFLLYRHAYTKRNQLRLNNTEMAYLHYETRDALYNMIVGFLSCALAFVNMPDYSGIPYLTIPVWLIINHMMLRKKIRDWVH